MSLLQCVGVAFVCAVVDGVDAPGSKAGLSRKLIGYSFRREQRCPRTEVIGGRGLSRGPVCEGYAAMSVEDIIATAGLPLFNEIPYSQAIMRSDLMPTR